MKRARILLAASLLPLLALLGAGIYTWLHLPALLSTHLSTLLAPHGVQDFSVAEMSLNGAQLGLRGVRLTASRNDQRINIALDSARLGYSWQSLLQARADSVSIDHAHIAVHTADTGITTTAKPLRLTELLPTQFLRSLPVSRIEVGSWLFDYQLTDSQTLTFTGDLISAEQLQLNITTSIRGATTSLALTAPLADLPLSANMLVTAAELVVAETTLQLQTPAPGLWQWRIEGLINHRPLLAWLTRLAAADLLPAGLIPASLPTLAGSSRVTLDVSHPDQLASQDFASAGATATATGRSEFTAVELGDSLREANAALDWSLHYAPDNALLEISALNFQAMLGSATLALSPAQLEWLGWSSQVPVRWQSPQTIALSQLANQDWQLRSLGSSLRLGDASSRVRLDNIALQSLLTPGSTLATKSEFTARLMIRLREQNLPQLEMEFSQQGNGANQTLDLVLADITESLRMELAGVLAVQSGIGQYQLNVTSPDLPWLTSMSLPVWKQLMGSAPRVTLAQGTLSLHSKLVSTGYAAEQWQQQSTLELNGLTGAWDDYLFENASLSAAWSGWENPATSSPVTLAIDRLNLGVELGNLRAQLSLPGNVPLLRARVNLEAFTADIFSGRVFLSEPTQWDLGAARNAVLLRAENWQLGDIVALQQNQDISAGGVLQGEIPVQFSGGRFTIGSGYLQALAPGGRIRYALNESSMALADTSEQLRLALALLADFQYQVLASTVSLDQTGALHLGLSLSGSNPAYENGRQVNFNINLEQNLDPLLQSLRLSDSLLQQLEDKLR